MPELPLSYDDTLALLREVIAEKGEDYVYEQLPDEVSCKYVHPDGPGCIVAHVFVRAGVSLDDPSCVEGHSPTTRTAGRVEWFHEWATPDARRLLGNIQESQDNGVAWSEALQRALGTGDPDE